MSYILDNPMNYERNLNKIKWFAVQKIRQLEKFKAGVNSLTYIEGNPGEIGFSVARLERNTKNENAS